MTAEPTWEIAGAPIRGRSCGKCTACCVQLPVDLDDGRKPANIRCRHLSPTKRCSIYAARPLGCRLWSCRWLFDEAAADLKRPDIGGYVVDPMLDTILLNGAPVSTLQVWVDPRRRDAHRAPELRRYIPDVAARLQMPTIVRFASNDGLVLFAPGLVGNSDWHEQASSPVTERELEERLADVAPERRRFNQLQLAAA